MAMFYNFIQRCQ